MHQSGMLAAAALYGIQHNVERLAEDHSNAKLIFDGISDIYPLISLYRGANMIYVDVSATNIDASVAVSLLSRAGVHSLAWSSSVVRFMTHINISTEAAVAARNIIGRTLSDLVIGGFSARAS
jgi:threonine aldolase